MRTRPAEIGFAIALALVMVAGIFTGGCSHCRPSVDSSRLDIRMTGADSPEDIENRVKASLAEKYAHEDMTDSYTMHHVTNGPARWVFVKAYNAPRGLNMFNLYCYEQEKPGNWLLRAYVPVNAYYYTNGLDRDVTFKIDDDYIKVVFRGEVVFTGASKK
jgi:hypothetical protein